MTGRMAGLPMGALLLACATVVAAQSLPVSDFAGTGLDGWAEKRFEGDTDYRLVTLDGRRVLRADSRGSASGLFRKLRVDLRETPFLNWSWRVENRLATGDEQTRGGDDYAARVYVVVDGGLLLWRTKAVNYVWAHGAEKGATWPNAFAGNSARMVAVRNREDALATWVVEKRNVLEDLQRLFGAEIAHIDAVAIMTDTDNGGGQATAYYGELFFTAE